MRKYAIILIAVTLISILACGLVACKDKEKEYTKPIAWSKYVDEVIDIMSENYDIGNNSVGFETSFNIKRRDNGIFRKQKIDIALNLSLEPNNTTDRLIIRIEGETYDGTGEIFLLSADNKTMYLHIYEWQYDKHSYYQYDKTPIFDVFRKYLPRSLNLDGKTSELIKIFADTILTDANVNKDKSEYIFDFTLSNIFESSFIKTIEKVLNLSSGTSFETIFNGISGDTLIVDAIRGAKGQIIVSVNENKIGHMQIKLSTDNNVEINIESLELSASPLNLKAYVPSNIEDYKTIKIGTVSINGTIRATDKYKINTIVTYDYELNVSLDLIQLLANDWDFSALDDENYFHFRLSHTCSSTCTDFCSVELGNKLMNPKGSVLDIAFAPKDFGTHNLYVSTSLKSLISEKIANELVGSSNLASLLLSDYQLFTISLPERRELKMAEGGGSRIQSSTNMLESLISIIKSFKIELWSIEINTSELKDATEGLTDSETLSKIFDLISENGIESIIIDMGNPQYDSVRTYDIKDMAIHIATLDIADGESGIKKYNNGMISSGLRPSLEWAFNDGAYDDKDFVNNIYQSNSESSTKIYSKDIPVSPEELKNLKGGYLKYHFTDYLGDDSTENTGFVKILDVVHADYSLIGEYQTVVLKVGYPSMNVVRYSFASLVDTFDSILYTSVKIKVKLTKLIDYSAKRIDLDKDGNIVREYNALEFYSTDYNKLTSINVAFNYEGGLSKTVLINGETDALIARSTLYIVSKLGEQKLKYSICGKPYEETITFNAPKTKKLSVVNQEGDSVYRKTFKMEEPIKIGDITKEICLYYSYREKEKNLALPISLFKINGMDIAKKSFEWDIIPGSTESSLLFYREGIFEISAEYLGETVSYEIEITSQQVGESTYQVIDKMGERVYFTGPTYTFNTEIVNKTHGSVNGQFKLELVVERGRINNSGSLTYVRDDSSWALTSNTLNRLDIENGSTVELPAMIINPYKYDFKIYFVNSGYYRIRIRLDTSTMLTKEIEVREAIGNAEYTIGTNGAGVLRPNAGEDIELIYKLSNRYHGNIGAELPICVQITKKNSNGEEDISNEVYEIISLSFNGKSVALGDVVVLPPSIFEPYDILLNMNFKQSGEYRVRIKIGDVLSTAFSITVVDNQN